MDPKLCNEPFPTMRRGNRSRNLEDGPFLQSLKNWGRYSGIPIGVGKWLHDIQTFL